ncbi:hypothetical protein PRVXH_002169 [Proteinivorax hydrogeniformans]|uniref:Tetratricopeptide repeat protein n=1 Tax=Proteinivorax hydrogeniformans TaxID=1826727 RepID=A0AAU8HRV4_9FIRM
MMNIAFVRNDLGYKDEYLSLMEFCLTQVEQRDNLHPIICHNLATSYYRNKMYKEALKYGQLGIEAYKKSRVFNQMHSLYYMS